MEERKDGREEVRKRGRMEESNEERLHRDEGQRRMSGNKKVIERRNWEERKGGRTEQRSANERKRV